jgi:hypothetical protein
MKTATQEVKVLRVLGDVYRWQAIKDGRIIYQYAEGGYPQMFRKTAVKLPHEKVKQNTNISGLGLTKAKDTYTVEVEFFDGSTYKFETTFTTPKDNSVVTIGVGTLTSKFLEC